MLGAPLKGAGAWKVEGENIGEGLAGSERSDSRSCCETSACLSPCVQTRRSADWLSVEMSQDGHQVAILTAELTVAQRADVIQRFRDGKEKVLIATNVCARGSPGKPKAPSPL